MRLLSSRTRRLPTLVAVTDAETFSLKVSPRAPGAGLPETGYDGEPGSDFEAVGDEDLNDAARGRIRDGKGRGSGAVVEDCTEAIGVVLSEGVETGPDGVSSNLRGDGGLCAAVDGGPI